jgi:hypothetical protein
VAFIYTILKLKIRCIYYVSNDNLYLKQSKGKAIPLQAWRGPEVSKRLWLPDFKTIGT